MTKMLVIDDNADARQMLRMILEFLGNEVDEAEEGMTGLAKITQNCPDIVLLDYSMPGMSGDEVAAKAKAICEDLPILFVTAHGNLIADKIKNLSHTDILAKPFTFDVLKHRITALLH